jgi:hypothetical protein
VNKPSVAASIVTTNISVAEANTCTIKYFSDASVLYIFLILDISGMKDIKFTSSPIHALNHEFEDTDTNTPLTMVVSKRIFVGLLDTREESFILYLWGMNPLAFISLLFYFNEFLDRHFTSWCMVHGGF